MADFETDYLIIGSGAVVGVGAQHPSHVQTDTFEPLLDATKALRPGAHGVAERSPTLPRRRAGVPKAKLWAGMSCSTNERAPITL